MKTISYLLNFEADETLLNLETVALTAVKKYPFFAGIV
jgi:hypothetical protein